VIALGLGLEALRVVPPLLAPPPMRSEQPLVAIEPAAVDEVGVWSDAVEARLTRGAGGEWALSGPGITGGRTIDGETVEAFLDVVRRVPRLTQFVDPDLSAFGLAPPRGRVAIRDGGETTLAIGDRNPPLTALYIQVMPAPDVVLVGSLVLWEFDRLVGAVAREADRTADGPDPAVDR
jgi:hypothetical protein